MSLEVEIADAVGGQLTDLNPFRTATGATVTPDADALVDKHGQVIVPVVVDGVEYEVVIVARRVI